MRRRAAAALVLAGLCPHAASTQLRGGPSGGRGWVVVHTWPWTGSADAGAAVLAAGGRALDAVVAGASAAEADPAAESVGRGAHPDAAGEVTLDALVMDGDTARVGAVGALRGVANAAQAAALVLVRRRCSCRFGACLCLPCALCFASRSATRRTRCLSEVRPPSLQSPLEDSRRSRLQATPATLRLQPGSPAGVRCACSCLATALLTRSLSDATQPNYWVDTAPPPASGCGPFQPQDVAHPLSARTGGVGITPTMHDTISLAALDARGSMASATSTNGLGFKLPGRVGDGAIAGGGSYSRTGVGACGATGDGDIMAPFLPCYQVVESMRLGMTPQQAAEDAILRIASVAPHFTGAVFALRADGKHAGACYNWVFQYTVRAEGDVKARVFTVQPLSGAPLHRPRLYWTSLDPALLVLLGAAFAAGAACAWVFTAQQRSSAAARQQQHLALAEGRCSTPTCF